MCRVESTACRNVGAGGWRRGVASSVRGERTALRMSEWEWMVVSRSCLHWAQLAVARGRQDAYLNQVRNVPRVAALASWFVLDVGAGRGNVDFARGCRLYSRLGIAPS